MTTTCWMPFPRWLRLSVLFVILMAGYRGAFAFSGEDLLRGNPWYHQLLTERAARACGFDQPAVDTLKWHADYIDSYAYNPLWWADGGISRLKVSLATVDELAKLEGDSRLKDALEALLHDLLGDPQLLQLQCLQMPSQLRGAAPRQTQVSAVQLHPQAGAIHVRLQVRDRQLVEPQFDSAQREPLDAESLAQLLPVEPAGQAGEQRQDDKGEEDDAQPERSSSRHRGCNSGNGLAKESGPGRPAWQGRGEGPATFGRRFPVDKMPRRRADRAVRPQTFAQWRSTLPFRCHNRS